MLDEWRLKKKEREKGAGKDENSDNKEDGEVGKEDSEEELDEFTKREDRVAKAGLDAIMREYAFELAKEPSNSKPVGKFNKGKLLICLQKTKTYCYNLVFLYRNIVTIYKMEPLLCLTWTFVFVYDCT